MQYTITVTMNGYILEEAHTDRTRIGKQWVFATAFDLQQHLYNEHNL